MNFEDRIAALIKRLERLIRAERGEDFSLLAAGEIESEIVTLFPEDEKLQEYADLLAQYRPGGGEYLYSETEIRPSMIECRDALRRLLQKER
ncbi:MAG: hypothetical protein ACJ76N_00060 [Thermoanaerobaculia bacterium]